MQNLKIKTLLLFFVMAPVSSWALDSDRTAKIIIQGPGCKTKLKDNQTECLKGLTIEQGSLLIKSTYGLIKHQDKGIGSVLMRGNQVYMEQLMEDKDKMVIKANEIDYQKAAEKVFLSGNVSITSSIGVTTGENLEFDLKTQEIISSGESSQPFRMEIDQKDD
jgi:lipopolysaccharide transport protein LptA